jgi:hypothetical protein
LPADIKVVIAEAQRMVRTRLGDQWQPGDIRVTGRSGHSQMEQLLLTVAHGD